MTPHEQAGKIRYALEQSRQTCVDAEDTITVEAIDEALAELRLLALFAAKSQEAVATYRKAVETYREANAPLLAEVRRNLRRSA